MAETGKLLRYLGMGSFAPCGDRRAGRQTGIYRPLPLPCVVLFRGLRVV